MEGFPVDISLSEVLISEFGVQIECTASSSEWGQQWRKLCLPTFRELGPVEEGEEVCIGGAERSGCDVVVEHVRALEGGQVIEDFELGVLRHRQSSEVLKDWDDVPTGLENQNSDFIEVCLGFWMGCHTRHYCSDRFVM